MVARRREGIGKRPTTGEGDVRRHQGGASGPTPLVPLLPLLRRYGDDMGRGVLGRECWPLRIAADERRTARLGGKHRSQEPQHGANTTSPAGQLSFRMTKPRNTARPFASRRRDRRERHQNQTVRGGSVVLTWVRVSPLRSALITEALTESSGSSTGHVAVGQCPLAARFCRRYPASPCTRVQPP